MPRVTNTTVYFKTKSGEFGTQMYRCAVYVPLCFLFFVHDQRYKWVCLQSPNCEGGPIRMLEAFTCKSQTEYFLWRWDFYSWTQTKGTRRKQFDWLSEWSKRAGLLSDKAWSVRESILFDVAHSSALPNANRSSNDKPLFVRGRAELVSTTSITGEWK